MKQYKTIRAALFDFDGVVCDTESQYSVFWGGQCSKYHPEEPGLEHRIKGQTLVQILDTCFSGQLSEYQHQVVEELNEYEKQMDYCFVPGFEPFIKNLQQHGVKTAVVTSSNMDKMRNVYRQHPDFEQLFDRIITSEDFTKSKPHPECYQIAAEGFGLSPSECVVFEDSFNGLKSGRAAQMSVVALATTNSREAVDPYSDVVISDYTGFDYEKMCRLLAESHCE